MFLILSLFVQVVPKPAVKEQTRPVEFRHFSNSRAIERAEFDSYVSFGLSVCLLEGPCFCLSEISKACFTNFVFGC